jgi:hypothetical protein
VRDGASITITARRYAISRCQNTLSGSPRVGFIACRQDLADEIADIKMLTSIASSQIRRKITVWNADGWPLSKVSDATARAA